MVTTSPAHEPVTPGGKNKQKAHVAPVVANVIGVIALLIQTVWLVPAAIVLSGLTVTVTVFVHPLLLV